MDYITKPFHPAEVIARVKLHLSLSATTQSLQAEIERHKQTVNKLEKANHALYRLANLDGLTQVANRYCFDESLTEEWFRLAREQKPIGIVLCDVDHFKVYNDHYGHQAGDECLRQIARAIFQSARRPADLVARYGGEEFVVLLPATGQEGVEHVAFTICNTIRNLQIPHAKSDSDSWVTISVGGCSLVPDVSMPPNTLVELADRALYQAKHQGRNQFVLAPALSEDTHLENDSSLQILGNTQSQPTQG
ncbi:MAG: diguanylate cyclase [Okeania sp. SIO2H7]|nr:diguanylate cyclase [Okeania sp. SIO2H7]